MACAHHISAGMAPQVSSYLASTALTSDIAKRWPLPQSRSVMPDRVLAEIEADIAEAERLISELRLEIAAKKSAGEDTSRSEQRVRSLGLDAVGGSAAEGFGA